MRIDILTIFPEFFAGPIDHGIMRRAREAGLVDLRVHDLRRFTRDRHRTVDDRPFGGGEDMVLKPEPIFECLEELGIAAKQDRVSASRPKNKADDSGASQAAELRQSVILLSPQGQLLKQELASQLAGLERMVLICGRYEGVDERVAEYIADREVSIGDYVLSGGELGAAVIADSVIRLVPGALGNEASAWQESFSRSPELAAQAGSSYTDGASVSARDGLPLRAEPSSTCGSGGLLDYPHYTRPADFRGLKVPEVLLSGNHADIRRWRRRKALEKTLRNRPDLLKRVPLSAEDKELIAHLVAEAPNSGNNDAGS